MNTSNTAKHASLLGLTAIAGAGIGFLLQLAMAYYFGAGQTTDAFFMAQSVSELLNKLLMGGSIAAVFLPVLVDYLSRNQANAAWQATLNITHIGTAIFGLFVAAVAFGARPLIAFIAPGFDAPTQELTASLLLVLLPSFISLFILDLLLTLLQARQQFTVMAAVRLLAPTVSLVAVVALAPSLHIFALAWGVVAASVIQVAIVLFSLHQQGFSYRFVFKPFTPELRQVLFLVYPFAASMLITQAAGIVYRVLVSDLATGSLSALKYSEKITQLLTVVLLNSVTTAMYPVLAELSSQKQYGRLVTTISDAMRLTLFLTVPITLGMILLREPLIVTLFQRGSFSSEAVQLTASALLFLALVLCTNTISSILGHTILALKRTRAAVAVTIASQAIAIILFILLVPRLQHAGLALASALVPLSSAALYFLHLRQYLKGLSRIFWHASYFKMAVLALVMCVVLLVYQRLPLPVALPGMYALLMLIVPTLLGGSVFIGGGYLWGMPEASQLVGLLANRFRKIASKSL